MPIFDAIAQRQCLIKATSSFPGDRIAMACPPSPSQLSCAGLITIEQPPDSSLDPLTSRTLCNVLQKLSKAKKVIIVAGAGISVNSGIPDFRSAGGLYAKVQELFPKALARGQDLFDANYAQNSATRPIFFRFMGLLKEMIDEATPTKCHHFFKKLKDANLLQRLYTQNIDQLENAVGLSAGYCAKSSNAVLLHGTMENVKCVLCKNISKFGKCIIEDFKKGNSVPCESCREKSAVRVALGKRSLAIGYVRPDIVLYNEEHPQGEEISNILANDISKRPDALIVMGTSLKVCGIKKLVREVSKQVKLSGGPVIFINKSAVVSTAEWKGTFNYQLLGCADFWSEYLEKNWLGTKSLVNTKIDQFFTLSKSPSTPKKEENIPDKKRNVSKSRAVVAVSSSSFSPSPLSQKSFKMFPVG